jgi:hypothetical protein
MKIFGLLLFLILPETCLAQFKMTKLDKNSVPNTFSITVTLFKRFAGQTTQATTSSFSQQLTKPQARVPLAAATLHCTLITTWFQATALNKHGRCMTT